LFRTAKFKKRIKKKLGFKMHDIVEFQVEKLCVLLWHKLVKLLVSNVFKKKKKKNNRFNSQRENYFVIFMFYLVLIFIINEIQ
jgi:hypothetical protein